jgi:hypothetical protein
MKLSKKLFIYGICAVILALFCTHHERIGFGLFIVSLIYVYRIFFVAGKHLYDD